MPIGRSPVKYVLDKKQEKSFPQNSLRSPKLLGNILKVENSLSGVLLSLCCLTIWTITPMASHLR
jgi:hypothetical protein